MQNLKLAGSTHLTESLRMLQYAGLEAEDTLVVGITFRCNNRCRFCIIRPEIDAALPDIDRRALQEIFAANARDAKLSRLVLSGAETTLLDGLADLARTAISTGGFERVGIQTNGRRLASVNLCEELLAAGIGEYFVSIQAHTGELDARLTRARASFPEMRRGVANLLAAGARVTSNTVITAENCEVLPEIASFLLAEGIREVNLWSFVEIGDAGQSDQQVPLSDLAAPLQTAISRLRREGANVVVKWVPRCLLGEWGGLLDNHQPQLLIHDFFQRRLGAGFRFDCAHRDRCRWFAKGCDGLHERYVERFGTEAELLTPWPG